ncbi:MAG: MerR family transcriptional regulator [Lachnospiraceae bacterium]|nr:MerR family transcriptional regulator [Lachnospiraceae bacterium]
MRTVKEVSELTGISVRALHYYDAIGLLKPTEVTDAGYRLYDDTALSRLQNILLFRELQFPLKEIKKILDSPEFNPAEVLEQQIKLLELQEKHIHEMICFAREIQEKGISHMGFDVFNRDEIDAYEKEIKERWGNTKAYEEYSVKRKDENYDEVSRQLLGIFTEIGALRNHSPEEKAVQDKIAKLQQFITEHYYTCTNEILNGLGRMYVADERMKKNIDRAGGDGTAEFTQQAIMAYCS